MEGKSLFYAVMCALCCVQMAVYIHFKLRSKGTAYTVSKCAGSLLFFTVALAAQFISGVSAYSLLVLLAMALSGVGDYFLSKPHGHHRLKLGAASFIGAHVMFVAAFISVAGFHWLMLPVIAAALLSEFCLMKATKLNCRGAGKQAAAYLAVVTVMAVSACWLLFGDVPRLSAAMTAAGGVLFLVSDCLWVQYGFHRGAGNRSAVKVLNVLTYFPAQMLIAGALLYM